MKLYPVALFLMVGSTSFSFAQGNQPRKFDEFSNKLFTTTYPYTEITPGTHINRFVREVRKRKGSRVYILVYHGRQLDDYARYEISHLAQQVEWRVTSIKGFDQESILIIDGGFREEPMLELWIGSRNSSPPAPTPTVAKDDVFRCPAFSVYPEGFYFDKSKPIQFNSYLSEGFSPRLKWTVSSGKIVSGQDTRTIIVSVSETADKSVTASLELEGLPSACGRAASRTVGLGKVPFLFDSTERYLHSDLHARIDAFMIALNNNPELAGYIIGYAARGNGSAEIDRALASVERIFRFRRYHSERVKLVNGGYREFDSVEMWLLPSGTPPPKPTPSVDSRFIKVLRRKVDLGEH